MLATSHVRLVAQDVRGRSAHRCAAKVLEGGTVTVIAHAFGLPRLWHLAANAVVEGFLSGYEHAAGHGRARVDAAVRVARETLAKRAETLVERLLPDAAFVACVLDGDVAHIVSAGPARAYLHRGTEPKRLTPRDEPREGILQAALAHSSVSLVPNDLILLGTESAFSVRAIGALSTLLAPGSNIEPARITEALTAPAVTAGVAAAAGALRVH